MKESQNMKAGRELGPCVLYSFSVQEQKRQSQRKWQKVLHFQKHVVLDHRNI